MIAVAMMLCGVNVQAQTYDYGKKHEVSVAIGGMSNSDWINIFEDIGFAMVPGMTVSGSSYFGNISAEYFYHPNTWLGIGGIFAYGNMKQDLIITKEKVGTDKNSYYTLMPTAKADWLRFKHFGLYSKVALGATLRTEKYDWNGEDTNSDVHFNWQVSLLGVEAGSNSIRAFAELGVGEQGIGLIGLRYKF